MFLCLSHVITGSLHENITLAYLYFAILGRLDFSPIPLPLGLFKEYAFTSKLFQWARNQYIQSCHVCVGFRRPNIGRAVFGFLLNQADMPCVSDSTEILYWVHFRYNLSKGTLILKIVDTFA